MLKYTKYKEKPFQKILSKYIDANAILEYLL